MRSITDFLRTSLGIASENVASFSHHQVGVVTAALGGGGYFVY
jgi:hypothetical protein